MLEIIGIHVRFYIVAFIILYIYLSGMVHGIVRGAPDYGRYKLRTKILSFLISLVWPIWILYVKIKGSIEDRRSKKIRKLVPKVSSNLKSRLKAKDSEPVSEEPSKP